MGIYTCSDVFFFQAEDGIRDLTVTGVQTCALPISAGAGHRAAFHEDLARGGVLEPGEHLEDRGLAAAAGAEEAEELAGFDLDGEVLEIGRASCRERV